LLTASAAALMEKKWFLKTWSNFGYSAIGKIPVVDSSLNKLSNHFAALLLLRNNNTQRILS